MEEPPRYQKLLSKDMALFEVDVEDQTTIHSLGTSKYESLSRVIFAVKLTATAR